MAKQNKKTLDENGNIVDVVSNVEVSEFPSVVIEAPKKREPTEYIFQLVNKVYYASPGKNPYPENYFLRNTDIIFDEETKTERNIRYLEGVNTIFVDEQEHLSDAKKNSMPQIRFVNGILRVPANKTSLVKFLTCSNMYNKKKNRMEHVLPVYTIVNFEEQEEQAINKAEVRMSAMKLAMDAPVEIMYPHAEFLGVRQKNQFGENRGEKAIRVDYLSYAEGYPDTFINTYNNPLVKVQYVIKKAIALNLIDLSTSKGQAIWGDTKKFIAQIPDNEDAVKHLAELCLTEKGKEFYMQLKSMAD
jgi:hypothetical protein